MTDNQSRTNPAVLIICVSFRSEVATRQFVGDLLSQQDATRLNIVVVDNGCNKESGSKLRDLTTDDLQVRVIEPGVNLGYFGGAAHVLSKCQPAEPLPNWIVVSNPDIRIHATNFFKQFLDLYRDNPPGVVAPAIRSALSRSDQNPYLRRRPSRARMHFYKWLFRLRLAARSYQRLSLLKLRFLRAASGLKGPINHGGTGETIYAAHGSFLLFHRSYFAAGGTFRHGTFLFGEEIFVAETARRLGLDIIYDPRLVVEHQQNTPSKILNDPKLASYARDAAAFVASKFF